MAPEDVERQRKLETEVSNLRLQLHSMTDTLVGLKEELKQREDSLQSQREAYEKLTEEFCIFFILFLIIIIVINYSVIMIKVY